MQSVFDARRQGRPVGIDDGHTGIAYIGLHGGRLGVDGDCEDVDNQYDHDHVAREAGELLDPETKNVPNPISHG